jgi:hypothetical protein
MHLLCGFSHICSGGFLFLGENMNKPTPTEQRRNDYFANRQSEFDFRADDRQEKLNWIESVIMPILNEV